MEKTTQSTLLGTLKNFFTSKKQQSTQISPDDNDTGLVNRGVSERQMKRLSNAIDYNYKKMEKLRKTSHAMRRQYMTHLLAEDFNVRDGAVVINKIMDNVRIWLQNLATGEPRVGINPVYPNLRPFASSFELAVNRHISEIKIGDIFHLGVIDALFSVGVFKTGLAAGAPDLLEVDGVFYDPGRAFTDTVFVDNLVVDVGAEKHTDMRFIGDRYLRPKKWVEDMIKAARSGDTFATIADRMESQQRPESNLSGFDEGDKEGGIYDEAWVWDLYLPKENLVVTVADGSHDPIAMWEWEGPEGGPYDMLGWMWVPGHPLPVPPIAHIYEMHMFANESFRKVGRQTNRQKDVLAAEAGAEKAVDIIKTTNDGGIAILPHGSFSKMQNLKYGGADPMVSQMLVWTLGLIDTEGGNLQSLGGLGPSAETYRGDQLVHDTASNLIKFLQLGLGKAVKNILSKHAWYVWTEDIRSYSGSMEIPGADIQVPWTFTPEEREGDFLDYNFRLEPHSLVDRTPMEKAQMLMQFWQGFVMPSAEIMMQAGIMPNAMETAKYLTKQLDLPFDVLFQYMDPQQQQQAAAAMQGQVGAPPRMKTSHTVNERISRPGTTPRGQDNAMMQSLGGALKMQTNNG